MLSEYAKVRRLIFLVEDNCLWLRRMEDPQTFRKTSKNLTWHLSAAEYSIKMHENL